MDSYDPVNFPHRDITKKVIGVFYDVYNELGFGFLESVYETALLIALKQAGLRAENGKKLAVMFRGEIVGQFEPDILVEHKVLLEIKAIEALQSEHEAQILNYLKATSIEVGLLMNFGFEPKIRRFAFSNERKQSRPEIQVD